MRRVKLPQLGVVIAVCALVGALAGIAGSAAAPSKSSKQSSSGKSGVATGAAQRHGRFRGGPGRGMFGPGPAVHAEMVVPNKDNTGFITVTTDAGTVKSVSGSDVTIDESVGSNHYKDATVTIPGDAQVVRNHAKASLSDVKAGDDIRVVASSEQTIVIAESAAFQQQERKRFHGFGHRGPGGPGGPPPPNFNGAPPAPPQGGGSTY